MWIDENKTRQREGDGYTDRKRKRYRTRERKKKLVPTQLEEKIEKAEIKERQR